MEQNGILKIGTILTALILLSVCIYTMQPDERTKNADPADDVTIPEEPKTIYSEMYLVVSISIAFPKSSVYTCVYVDDVLWRVWPSVPTDGSTYYSHSNVTMAGGVEYEVGKDTYKVRVVCALVTTHQPTNVYTMYDKEFEITPLPIPDDWTQMEQTKLKVTI